MATINDVRVILTKEELPFHEEMVDEGNREYADSITPEYIAEQHALQSEWLTKGVDPILEDTSLQS